MTTKFMFLRDSKRNPVACVATNYDKETNRFYYQYSVVHSDDQFNKNRGRQIAEGRLRSNPIELINEQDADKQWRDSMTDTDKNRYYNRPWLMSVLDILKVEYFRKENICPMLDSKSNMESIITWLANTNSPTKLKNAAKLWLANKNKVESDL